MRTEGISVRGYIGRGLHKEPWVEHVLNEKVHRPMGTAKRLREYREQNHCPRCDQIRRDMLAFWSRGIVLGEQQDMDQFADPVFTIH